MTDYDYRDLDAEEKPEIDNLASLGRKRLNVSDDADNVAVLDAIKEYVAKVGNLSVDDLNDVAYELGSVYGMLIAKQYGWDWYFLDDEDNDVQFYCVAPKDKLFCCPVHEYFYEILQKKKTDNSKLLFNMLATLDKSNSIGPFTILK